MVQLKRKKNRSFQCNNTILAIAGVIAFVLLTMIIAVSNVMNGGSTENTVTHSTISSSNNDSNKSWFEKEKPLITEFPPVSKRNDIVDILEKLKWKSAIEVGVQKGLFAKKMLDNWHSCTEYKLVDLWGKEEGYEEPGAHSSLEHEMNLGKTHRRVKGYEDKVEFFVMRSTEAAKFMKDSHFDFVYLDARHDYCAVAEDIEDYWPKVRPGGILAGHDFIDAQYAIERLGESENWGICEDGTKQPRAVRGAVEDFAKKEKIEYILSSKESFPSWFIQKPYDY